MGRLTEQVARTEQIRGSILSLTHNPHLAPMVLPQTGGLAQQQIRAAQVVQLLAVLGLPHLQEETEEVEVPPVQQDLVEVAVGPQR